MELWFMECVAFGCVAIGVCAIVYCVVRAFAFVAKWQRDEEFEAMEKSVRDKDEQIKGLRATVDYLQAKIACHCSHFENCAQERENKNL